MSSKSKGPEKEYPAGAAAGQAFWQSVLRQGSEWLQPHPEAFTQLQRAAETWLRHRGEDYQKGLAAATQMAASKDFSQAAAIQQKWVADCAQSLLADWMAMMAPMTPANRRPPPAATTEPVAVEKAAEPAAG